jgi:hypothetical protein
MNLPRTFETSCVITMPGWSLHQLPAWRLSNRERHFRDVDCLIWRCESSRRNLLIAREASFSSDELHLWMSLTALPHRFDFVSVSKDSWYPFLIAGYRRSALGAAFLATLQQRVASRCASEKIAAADAVRPSLFEWSCCLEFLIPLPILLALYSEHSRRFSRH